MECFYFDFSNEIINISRRLSLNTPAQNTLLSDKVFVDRLKAYFDAMYQIKMSITIALDNSEYGLITITGPRQSVNKALEELSKMQNLFLTMVFTGTTGKKFFFDFTAIKLIV